MPAHRPFWVLRHRVTGQTKRVSSYSVEDGMWEVVLTDGSESAAIEHEQPKLRVKREKKDAPKRRK
ncbi:MAG: hypothetical protein EOP84_02525 [Verrucomicrobiaceae bacterium]|nr:MAG: hypothetical protein EOP84_02525 [Verrucomicrobiaceae bacterium]